MPAMSSSTMGAASAAPSFSSILPVARHSQRPSVRSGRWILHAGTGNVGAAASSGGRRQQIDKPTGGPHASAAHAASTAVASGATDAQYYSGPAQAGNAGQQQHRAILQGPPGALFDDHMPFSITSQRQGAPSWQVRQQQQQLKKQQQRQKWQQRQGTGALKVNKHHMFSDCCSYQSLLDALQQQQPYHAPQAVAQGQQHPQQMWQPSLSIGDCFNLVKQLAVISKSASSSSSSVGSSSSFVEDQALLQILPLVYDTLDYYANPQQQAATAAGGKAGGSAAASLHPASLRPSDLLCCISILAALKYSQPARLAALLELRSAGRLGLSGLRMQQLSGLVAALARAGVRPSNAWLLALMQEAERRFPSASLPQLSQLLHGLVKMGIKPAASWLDSLQDQAVQCLIEQAVRCQVGQEQMQRLQQQQQQQQQSSQPTAEPSSTGGEVVGNSPTSSSISSSSTSGAGVVGDSWSHAACQLHDIAQLLTALAEARHSPKTQLSAALWGATASSLAAADVAPLVELLSALGELQLVPPASWMEQYYSSTALHLQQGQYKPWQLADSVKALGVLAKAGLQCCHSSEVHTRTQPRQQQTENWFAVVPALSKAHTAADQSQQRGVAAPGHWECSGWVAVVLSVVLQQLSSFAARDIAALLSGLAALNLPMDGKQLQAVLYEAEQKLPRLNTAGLAMLAEAAVDLEEVAQDQAQQQQQQRGPALLTSGWMGALLQEAAVKLPMFPADDLARLLIALSRCSVCKPSSIWLEAAAVQLQSKLTVLDPCVITQVMTAFVALGYMPGQQWLKTAVAAVEGRAIELGLGDVENLLEFFATAGYKPDTSFLATPHCMMLEQQQQQQHIGGQQQQPLAGKPTKKQTRVSQAERIHEGESVSGSSVQN